MYIYFGIKWQNEICCTALSLCSTSHLQADISQGQRSTAKMKLRNW